MAFNEGDSCYACLQASNTIAINQTNNTLRLFRDVVSDINTWSIGDTIVIQDATYKLFGHADASELAALVVLKDADNNDISCTTSGQGTGSLTVTLTESVVTGDLVVQYRVGIPATYVELCGNKGNPKLNCHKVDLVGSHSYQAVLNQMLSVWGGTGTLVIHQLDGVSIQSNPPV